MGHAYNKRMDSPAILKSRASVPNDGEEKTRKPFFFSKRELATVAAGACGFFIGRAVVFSVNPLAIAYLSTFLNSGYAFFLTAALTGLGLATRLNDIFIARYIIAIALMCAFNIISGKFSMPRAFKRNPALTQAGAAAASVLLAGAAAAALIGNSNYLYLTALLETVLTGSLSLIAKRAAVILTARRRRGVNYLSGEDMTALAIVLASVIAGASDIIVGVMPLRFFMCLYVVFIIAFKGGAAMAAAAGMLLGLFLNLTGYWDISMCAVFGLSGMAGGFFRKNSRPVIIIAALCAFFLSLAVLSRSNLDFSLIYASVFAGAAFMLTPAGFYFNVAAALNPIMDSADDYMDKIREETTRRLDSFAQAFEKLADTFSGLSKPKTSLNKTDISQLIDDLSERACNACPNQSRCWEDDFYHTYQHIFAMLDACGKKGAAAREDMDTGFYNHCGNPEILIRELNAVFSLYKTNLRWNNRIAESRELVSQQLSGVSGIIRRLSEEIDISLKFHEGLEEAMIAALLNVKIEVGSVIVLENKAGKYQVTVSQKPCFGRRKDGYANGQTAGQPNCVNDIVPVINSILKRRMRCADTSHCCETKKGYCVTRFVEDQNLRVTSGVARRAKYRRGGSGDSYSFMELKNGQCLLVLSDGMGAGEKARRESAATVELLEDFIESGFDKELAVRMINSVLVLKSSEESFSTLDICSVDLYTGDAEFIKIGAASTFLLRNGKVSVIRSSSLPMGMLNDVDLEVSARKLLHNDIILMITDGVTEAFEGDREGWLTETLRACRYHNPQDVADYILEEAERSAGGAPRDDMTVLAARVWERV